MAFDDLPPGYSQSDVVGGDLPPGYKASDVISKPKKLAPVVNAQGKSTYMPSESAGPTPGASPFKPPVVRTDQQQKAQTAANIQRMQQDIVGSPIPASIPSLRKKQLELAQAQKEAKQKSIEQSGNGFGIPSDFFSQLGGALSTPLENLNRFVSGSITGTPTAQSPPSVQQAVNPGMVAAGQQGDLSARAVNNMSGFIEPSSLATLPFLPKTNLAGTLALMGGTAAPQLLEDVRSGDKNKLGVDLLTAFGPAALAHMGGKAMGLAKPKKPLGPAEILQDFRQTPQEVSDVPAMTRRRLPGTTGEQPKLLAPPADNAFVVDAQGNAQRANIGNLQNPDVLGRPNAIEKPPTRPTSPFTKPTVTAKPSPTPAPANTTPTEPVTPPRTQGEAALGETHPNERDILEVHPLTGQEFKNAKEMQDAADTMNTLFPGSNAAVQKVGKRNTLTIDKGWETKSVSPEQKPNIPKAPETVTETPQKPGETPNPNEVTYDTLENDDSKRAGVIRDQIQAKLDSDLPAETSPDAHAEVLKSESVLGKAAKDRVNAMNKAAMVLSRSASTWADKLKARQVIKDLTSEEGFEGTRTDITGPQYGRRKGESEGSFAHRIRIDFSDTEWGNVLKDSLAKIEDLKAKGQANAVPEQKPNASVPGQEGPQVELQGMGEGNPKPESTPEQKGPTIKKSNPRQGSFDASILEDVARAVSHGAQLIGNKVVTFAKWSAEMVKEFGETIRPHLVKLWDQSHDAYAAGATKKTDETIPPNAQARIDRLNAQTGKPEQKPTAGENIGNAIKGAWMAPSAWQTIATPFHSVLRHGLPLTLNHPGMAAESVGQTWKAFASKEGFSQVREFIDNLPTKQMADHFGVADTGQHIADPTKGEEDMIGNAFLNKLSGGKNIPVVSSAVGGLKNAMNANHRGFVTYLDLMAQKGFAKKAAQLEQWGITPAKDEAAYRGLAGLINNERGRGSLGPLENQAALAAAVMYAPRLQVSRIALMNPVYYAKMEPGVRRIAVTDAAKGIGVAVSAIMAAKAAGAEVSTDPRDSNFLKMKIGNRYVDPLGGFRSYVPLVVQSVTGQKVVNGQLKNNVSYGESRGTVAGKLFTQELRKKFSPSFGMAYNLSPLSKDKDSINRNAVGDVVTPVGETTNLATPFFGRDLIDYFKHNDIGSTIAGEIASQLGASSYEPSVRASSFKSKGLGGANMKSLLK